MGAKVLVWSRSRKDIALDELLSRSEIVSLHLPLTAETQGVIDVRKMKPGAILVNTARGGLVDEKLLIEALRGGHLAAAGLDVFTNEPLPADHPLLRLENVVPAPHLAWLTQETLARSVAAALRNVRNLRSGLPLENRLA